MSTRIIYTLCAVILVATLFMALASHLESPRQVLDLLQRNRAKPTPTPDPSAFAPTAQLLLDRCATERCHDRGTLAGQLNLSPDWARGNMIGVWSLQKTTEKLVIPGEPQHSYLLAKVRGEKGIKGVRMPLGQPPLSTEQEKVIEDWITQGAQE